MPFARLRQVSEPFRLRGQETGHGREAPKVWYDPEGDFLEVIFDQKPGYFRETTNDQFMEKMDEAGNILGFSILKVSALNETPVEGRQTSATIRVQHPQRRPRVSPPHGRARAGVVSVPYILPA